jgi:hypothetical protein
MLFSYWFAIWIFYWNLFNIINAIRSTVAKTNKTPNTIVRGNIDGWKGAASQVIALRSSFAAMYDPSYVTTIRVHDS